MPQRNHRSAKAAGRRMETAVARYLAAALEDDRVEVRTRNGAKDRGDIAGVRVRGHRVVVEVKSAARLSLPGALAEAAVERDNDDAAIGVVVHKRHGVSERTCPGAQLVCMTLADLAWLLGADIDPRQQPPR